VSAAGRGAARDKKEAASPPLTFPQGCRAAAGGRAARGYGAAPPGSRLLRIACGDGPCGAGPDPGDHCGPSGRKHGQASLPRPRRGASGEPGPRAQTDARNQR
jgi:hypothetical protein